MIVTAGFNPTFIEGSESTISSDSVILRVGQAADTSRLDGDTADWAPDLLLAKERFKPDWIESWLLDPQIIQPGTKMPKFFREGTFQDISPVIPEEQSEAIKDLLINLPEDMFTEQ